MLKYKGFIGKYEYDNEIKMFCGDVQNIKDVITFAAANKKELRKAFKESIEDYLDFCLDIISSPSKAKYEPITKTNFRDGWSNR